MENNRIRVPNIIIKKKVNEIDDGTIKTSLSLEEKKSFVEKRGNMVKERFTKHLMEKDYDGNNN